MSYVNVKDFGAKGDLSVDDGPAIQAAINATHAVGGGTIFVPRGKYLVNTKLAINGNYVRMIGDCPGATVLRRTIANGGLLGVTGQFNAVENLSMFQTEFSTSGQLIDLTDAVQTKLDNLDCTGGFRSLLIRGAACADNLITRSKFDFATGVDICRVQRNPGAGLNGGHHFYRCLFNQAYPLGTPVASNYKGTRNNLASYTVGDIVISGAHYLRCVTAGTTGSGAPSLLFYYTAITDGSVTWHLMGSVGYSGLVLDTGSSYCYVRECDLTGPFSSAIQVVNSLGGTVPFNHHIEKTTAHGPIFNGASVASGYEIEFDGFDAFGPTGAGVSYGIVFHSAASDTLKSNGCNVAGFTNGINMSSGQNGVFTDNTVYGCNVGVRVAAGVSRFNILGNCLGSAINRGANGTAIEVAVGASDYYNIAHNIVSGAGSGVSDGGTGINKSVSNNY